MPYGHFSFQPIVPELLSIGQGEHEGADAGDAELRQDAEGAE
jgi:hypothetical protein